MDITTFHTLTDQLFNQVESFLDNYADEHDLDIDYDIHGNVIAISFVNGSKIIINTQEPLFQIWLATRKQGYHFDYLNGDWICNRTDKSFKQIFSDAVHEQAS
ncbi:iron donor protein CyaY [Orbaceae bacterium ESL0727]|nr:iron donor protein CyaY [Orbaceae bacterium ESL0727]